MNNYDVIVVGGGHAGCEAALASSRLGLKTLLFTLYLDNIAMMSCNPAVGGPGKSHLVTEIDILGGEIGRHIDKYNLQLKHLNTSKGVASKVTRGQADKYLYRVKLKEILEKTKNLEILQGEIKELLVEKNKIIGVKSNLNINYYSKGVILATGTFLGGNIVIGNEKFSGGRIGEYGAYHLAENLKNNGIELEKYQTATPPRIDKKSVDFSKLKKLSGEDKPSYFSIFTKKEKNENIPTWLTFTTEKTIETVEKLLKYSPIVTGKVASHGPRHCPSVDRKVLNFPEKKDHQIFLEQESMESNELYVNGLTTAMPTFAQDEIIKTITGLENAKIMRYGYAVEYFYSPAQQLYPTLESKKIEGLYFAGQINGTSGYEEAAAQGFIAGVNCSRKIKNEEEIIIDRSDAYIGVLIDDLIHKKTPEPYRVLPSRAEFRLNLRQDNAFIRLYEVSKKIALQSKENIEYMERIKKLIEKEIERLENIVIKPEEEINLMLESFNIDKIKKPIKATELLQRKNIKYDDLKYFCSIKFYEEIVKEQVEIYVKYKIFIKREKEQIEKFKKLESKKIKKGFNFEKVKGISNIALNGLLLEKPLSIGEASRISGVTSNDLALLINYINEVEEINV